MGLCKGKAPLASVTSNAAFRDRWSFIPRDFTDLTEKRGQTRMADNDRDL